ncbi:MAG: START-like domain-containing protein [Bacteroidia bacterium]|jgi:uncharacterized protein YndB with AHSA1/START domain
MAKAKSKPVYIKFEMEFPIHASKSSLFSYLSTPGGLCMWFADNVNLHDEKFIFYWEGNSQEAEILSKKENQFIRFRWLHDPDYTFFEFKISTDEITGDVALLVTDFAEDESAVDNAKLLWKSQIDDLHHVLGA